MASLGTSGTLFGATKQPILDPTGGVSPFCSTDGQWLPLLCTMNCTTVTEEVPQSAPCHLTLLELLRGKGGHTAVVASCTLQNLTLQAHLWGPAHPADKLTAALHWQPCQPSPWSSVQQAVQPICHQHMEGTVHTLPIEFFGMLPSRCTCHSVQQAVGLQHDME